MSQFINFGSKGGGGAGTVTFLAGNTGGSVGPNGGGIINIDGTGVITVTGNPGTNTLTISSTEVSSEFITNSGTATPILGVLNINGDGVNIATAAPGSTDIVTITLANSPSVSGTITAGTGLVATTGGLTVTAGGITSSGTTTLSSLGAGVVLSSSGGVLSTASGTTGWVLIANTGTVPTFGALGINSGLTNHGVLVGQGNSAIAALAVGATNTVLLGSTGANPVFGTVPNAALTNSTVTLNNGNNITVTGSPLSLGGTASFNLTGTTQYAVQVGNATGSLSSIAPDAANKLLASAGVAANPIWTTATYPIDVNQGDLLYASAGSTISALAKNTSATRYLSNTGTSNAPVWAQINLTNGVTGQLPIDSGGTNTTSSSYATDGVLYYQGTIFTTTTAGLSGQILTSQGGGLAGGPIWANPAAAGVTTLNGLTGAVTIATGSSGRLTVVTSSPNITLDIPTSPSFLGTTTVATGLTATTGNITATLGNFVLTAGNLTLGNSTTTTGQITSSGQRFIYQVGTRNFFAGPNVANLNITGSDNVGVGYEALFTLNTSGTSSFNTAVGSNSSGNLTGASQNTSLGYNSLVNAKTSVGNIAIGYSAGSAFTSNESHNIDIGNTGVIGDSGVIRIGTAGTQNSSFMAGVWSQNVGSVNTLAFVDSNGQLGTGPALPTNGQVPIGATGAGVRWANLTSDGTVIFTPGVNTLELSVPGAAGGLTTINTGSGTATVSSNAMTFANGTNINTTASGSTFVANLVNSPSVSGSITAGTGVTITAGGLTVSAGGINNTGGLTTAGTTTLSALGTGELFSTSGVLSALSTGSAGQLRQSTGATAPSWTTATYPINCNTTVQYFMDQQAMVISGLTVGTNNQVLLSNGTIPVWGSVSLTANVSGTLPIANGGTNNTGGYTTNGVFYYNGTQFVSTAAGSGSQVLGLSAGVPAWVSTSTFGGVPSVNANTGAITINGQSNQIGVTGSSVNPIVISLATNTVLPGNPSTSGSFTAGSTIIAPNFQFSPTQSGVVVANGSGVLSATTSPTIAGTLTVASLLVNGSPTLQITNSTISASTIILNATGNGTVQFDAIATGYSGTQWITAQAGATTTASGSATIFNLPALSAGQSIMCKAWVQVAISTHNHSAAFEIFFMAGRGSSGNIVLGGGSTPIINSVASPNSVTYLSTCVVPTVDTGTQVLYLQVRGPNASTYYWVTTYSYMILTTNT